MPPSDDPQCLNVDFASVKHTRKSLLITPETHHIRAARHHCACIRKTELHDCRTGSTRECYTLKL